MTDADEDRATYWNRVYEVPRRAEDHPADDWLERHRRLIESMGTVRALDLGCGRGGNIPALLSMCQTVVAADVSAAALASVPTLDGRVTAVTLDMEAPLPFADGSFDLVLSDLSLHYFSWASTRRIADEIERILSARGFLLCRVNSTGDRNYGAAQGREVEPRYYEHDGHFKRFFVREDLEELFAGWRDLSVAASTTRKYGPVKAVYEVFCRRSVSQAEGVSE